jgi:hypothetical protein
LTLNQKDAARQVAEGTPIDGAAPLAVMGMALVLRVPPHSRAVIAGIPFDAGWQATRLGPRSVGWAKPPISRHATPASGT